MTDEKLQIGLLLPTRGIVLTGRDPVPVGTVRSVAERAEAMGIDSLWVGDSLTAKPRLEPLATLAAVAAWTTRPRLGTAVLLGALRHPVLLAQTAATLDLISGGRLTLGIGVGGAFNPEQQQEWAAAGVDRRRRARRLEEVVEVLHRLWSGEPTTYHGEHITLDGASIGYRPHQRPGVPILLASHSGEGRERQYARTARLADGMISISDSPEEFTSVRGRVRDEARAQGRDPDAVRAVFYMTVNLGPDAEAARAEATDWIQRYYGLNFWGERWGPFGPAEGVVKRVREYAAAGADEVIIRFASNNQEAQLDLLEREVLPALR